MCLLQLTAYRQVAQPQAAWQQCMPSAGLLHDAARSTYLAATCWSALLHWDCCVYWDLSAHLLLPPACRTAMLRCCGALSGASTCRCRGPRSGASSWRGCSRDQRCGACLFENSDHVALERAGQDSLFACLLSTASSHGGVAVCSCIGAPPAIIRTALACSMPGRKPPPPSEHMCGCRWALT